jgi:hypothetical protein
MSMIGREDKNDQVKISDGVSAGLNFRITLHREIAGRQRNPPPWLFEYQKIEIVVGEKQRR